MPDPQNADQRIPAASGTGEGLPCSTENITAAPAAPFADANPLAVSAPGETPVDASVLTELVKQDPVLRELNETCAYVPSERHVAVHAALMSAVQSMEPDAKNIPQQAAHIISEALQNFSSSLPWTLQTQQNFKSSLPIDEQEGAPAREAERRSEYMCGEWLLKSLDFASDPRLTAALLRILDAEPTSIRLAFSRGGESIMKTLLKVASESGAFQARASEVIGRYVSNEVGKAAILKMAAGSADRAADLNGAYERFVDAIVFMDPTLKENRHPSSWAPLGAVPLAALGWNS